jgi:serine/threonine protein kinase
MGGQLPVRWSAVEVLNSGKFSRASDVWAFGCLVYEVIQIHLFTLFNIVTLLSLFALFTLSITHA